MERDVTAETFDRIQYTKVPSIAMQNYSELFAKKDFEHFGKYIEKVAEGKAKISGAVLLPSTLVLQCRLGHSFASSPDTTMSAKQLQAAKIAEVQGKVMDGQWKSLVQRIKDNGKLSSAIAVCDVSGSMTSPVFPDKTSPMDSAIGLSLLLAEITAPPFGGHFITFSCEPEMQAVDLTKSIFDKVSSLSRSHWSMNTDFIAVFERLILPAAIKHRLPPEDMVKRVFVFSDMQFDAAQGGTRRRLSFELRDPSWDTAFERIKGKFDKAGYELPHLVFWNLAGGRAGYPGSHGGDKTVPKPVTSDELGCTLVSGYSQGMLKMFLDEGAFGDEGMRDEIEEVKVGKDGAVETKTVKGQADPMAGLWRAVGHKAYDMLKVYD